MEKEYYVYCHLNKINNKRYFGITKQFPEHRWGVDGVNYKDKCPHFWSAIVKYGWNNFEHIIIASKLTKQDACQMEIDLIAEYKTQNGEFGYNILEGGTAPTIPDEVRRKMSVAMMGNTNGAGHPCSEEKKRKISEAQKGRVFTEEHKQKISESKSGKPHKPLTKETKDKISKSHKKKKVYCPELDTVYESIQDCARKTNTEATTVCACCKGRIRSIHSLHFEYYNEDNT